MGWQEGGGDEYARVVHVGVSPTDRVWRYLLELPGGMLVDAAALNAATPRPMLRDVDMPSKAKAASALRLCPTRRRIS